MGVSGRDVLQALDRVPPDLLCNVHFSDAVGYTEHLTPGKGALPLDDFLARLGKRGYRGYITLELEPGAFPDDVDGTVELLIRLRRDMEARLTTARSR
jgi:sugar phosphate isomerase/epimerase